MDKFGYDRPNVSFLDGLIEKLDTLGLEPQSFDVVVSNCVINLSIDKPAVLKGVFDLLKSGGEFYFADVYADRRLLEAARMDPVVYGECLGGALYWGDFLTLAKAAGFGDPRLVTSRPLEITDPEVEEKIGAARFYSATYRLGVDADDRADLLPLLRDLGVRELARPSASADPVRGAARRVSPSAALTKVSPRTRARFRRAFTTTTQRMPAIKVTVLRWPFGTVTHSRRSRQRQPPLFIKLAEISVSVYQLLEPAPVVLLTTAEGTDQCDDDVVGRLRAAAHGLRRQRPRT
jgi:hypothetical protein